MTAKEEANMWARLVALEKAIVKLLADKPEERAEEAPDLRLPEPPRDRYGTAVDRPGM